MLFESNTLKIYFYQGSQIVTFEAYIYLSINKKTDCAHLNRNVLLTSQRRWDLLTRSRRYLGVGCTTNGGRWEQPSSLMTWS